MASSKKYFLREFQNGDFMLWSVCSQAYNKFTVVIKDDKKTYANIKKTDTSTSLKKLSQDSSEYKGGSNLRVEVTFDNKKVEVKESILSGGITDSVSNTVGYVYTYCIEDGTDDDYNDVYINIVAWRKKG